MEIFVGYDIYPLSCWERAGQPNGKWRAWHAARPQDYAVGATPWTAIAALLGHPTTSAKYVCQTCGHLWFVRAKRAPNRSCPMCGAAVAGVRP